MRLLSTNSEGTPIEVDQSVIGDPDTGITFTHVSNGIYHYNLGTQNIDKGTYRLTSTINGGQKATIDIVLTKKN
jgi:hypothetical protein